MLPSNMMSKHGSLYLTDSVPWVSELHSKHRYMSATKISWISAEGYYWTIFIFWHSTKCTTYKREKGICRGEFQKCISIQTCITLVIYSQIYRNDITMRTIKWHANWCKYKLNFYLVFVLQFKNFILQSVCFKDLTPSLSF